MSRPARRARYFDNACHLDGCYNGVSHMSAATNQVGCWWAIYVYDDFHGIVSIPLLLVASSCLLALPFYTYRIPLASLETFGSDFFSILSVVKAVLAVRLLRMRDLSPSSFEELFFWGATMVYTAAYLARSSKHSWVRSCGTKGAEVNTTISRVALRLLMATKSCTEFTGT